MLQGPEDTLEVVVEIIKAILASQDMICILEGKRGLLYIDYGGPGDIQVRLDKVTIYASRERNNDA